MLYVTKLSGVFVRFFVRRQWSRLQWRDGEAKSSASSWRVRERSGELGDRGAASEEVMREGARCDAGSS
jgi:hypothetical protein